MGDFRDVDWTLRPNCWDEEVRLREVRNELIKAQLKKGKTVAYRSSGWSLWPRVCPNDLCVFVPVIDDCQVQEGDIVFCRVRPSLVYYAHLVLKKEWHRDDHAWKCWISNLDKHVNGYCWIEDVYGKLTQVLK